MEVIEMLQKVRNLPLLACMAIVGFVHDFKRDERALSGVVVAALLVLIGVLAVAAFWGPFTAFIATIWAKITAESAGF